MSTATMRRKHAAARRARTCSRGLALVLLVLSPSTTARATSIIEVEPGASRLEAIANEIRAKVTRALETSPGGALVLRVRSELPRAAPDPHGLIEALVRPAANALAEDARFREVHVAAFDGEQAGAVARAERLGYDVLVDLSIRAVGNFLVASGTAWPALDSTPRGAFDLRSRLDVELRRYLGPLPRVTAETVVARTLDLPSHGYLAMSAHDLDRDGRTELVLATATTISILRLGATQTGVRLVEAARAEVPRDVPRANVRTRRLLATSAEHDGAILVRSSALAVPLRVELRDGAMYVTNAETGPCADAFPIDAGCARLAEGRDYFEASIAPRSGEGAPHEAPGQWYSHSFLRLRTASGAVQAYEAIVTPLGRLALRIGTRAVGAAGYGTALAMADLDDDGAAELLTSAALPAGAGDRLSLLRALPRGALHVVWRSEPIEGSIWIAERGDLDGDGLDELFAIEEPTDPARGNARLWVLR